MSSTSPARSFMIRANRTPTQTMTMLFRKLKNKKGQTLVEYALILAFISVVAISVLISIGQTIKGAYTKISSALTSAQASH